MKIHETLPLAYSSNDEVWLCLTTLHHRRFVEDAIHLAGLPIGSRIRLRYRRKYISRDIWDRSEQGISSTSIRVLVALAATDGKQRNVIRPLRQGRVVSARCEGGILVIDISLEAFLSEGRESAFWEEVNDHHLTSPASFGPRPQDGIYLQKLTFSPSTVLGDGTIRAWEQCAEGFFVVSEAEASGSYLPADEFSPKESEVKPTGCVPFLYHLSVPEQGLRWKLLPSGSLSIEAGVSMSIEIHTITAPHLTVFHNAAGEVLMDVSNAAATFTSSRRVRIDSRRDVRAVRLATSALFRRSHGHLSVRTVVFIDEPALTPAFRSVCSADKREEVVIARHDFPLVVGNLMPILASLFVAVAAGVAVFKMPEAKEAIGLRHLSVPALVATLAFAGLLLGLRKDAK